MARLENAPQIVLPGPAPTRTATRSRTRTALDVALVCALAAVLLALFLWPTVHLDHVFPVGPDVPVYLWWARVVGAEGLSVVGDRPGVPAVLPVLSSLLDVGLVPTLAGLQYTLGPAIGLAGLALLRGSGRGTRAAWLAGGLLAGVWATHLGGGYVANMAMAAPFVAAAAALARRTPRGAAAAAIALGGGGFAHPQFFVVGAIVLATTAVVAWRRDRGATLRTGDAGRIAAALAGGAALLTTGLLWMLAGPARLLGDTSKDAFLRRVGHTDVLRSTYLGRFEDSWRRYAPIMNGILTVAGATHGRGFPRRFLVSWLLVTAIAVPLGALTGWFPPDRVLTFAFCIPLLAAIGLVWIDSKVKRPWLAWPVGIALVVLTALPTLRAWYDETEFISPDEIHAVTIAGRISKLTPPGTPLVFVVDDPETDALFHMARARNLARAAVPPFRVDDVVVYLGEPQRLLARQPTTHGRELYDLASATTLEDVPPGDIAVFVLPTFDRTADPLDEPGFQIWDPSVASTVADPRPLAPEPSELGPSTPGEIVGSTIRIFLLLVVIGAGWSGWALRDPASSLAASAAFGIAVLMIASVVAERLGVEVPGGSAAAIAAIAGGGGYALLVADVRRRRRDGAAHVTEG